MPQSRYFVVRNPNDEWVIKFQDEEFGPYPSQSQAMRFAIEAAHKLGAHGDNAEVCLVGINGNFRPEWTYGQSAYPPRIQS